MGIEKQKMVSGAPYRPWDAELVAGRAAAARWMERYNLTPGLSGDDRHAMLIERFAAVGAGAVLRAPFYCDYGFNISVGDGVFLNFNCVLLDVAAITIGARTQIGPAVQIYAADHPRDAVGRATGLETGQPVTIGADVWIGGGAIILPGVTIGDGAVIGAGSVVTRTVAPHDTVVGNPARSLARPSIHSADRGV